MAMAEDAATLANSVVQRKLVDRLVANNILTRGEVRDVLSAAIDVLSRKADRDQTFRNAVLHIKTDLLPEFDETTDER